MTTENKYTLEDLDFFWLPNGAPCFIGNNEDICEIVEQDLGFSIYYVIADKSTFKQYTQSKPATYNKGVVEKPAETKTITEEIREQGIFKIVKNMVGRCVAISTDAFGEGYAGIETEAVYNLPAIPKALVDKMDEFFRLVHAQHGTESILLLTFDQANPDSSDSWGVLVPKQENTSVHCKYDPDSVAELKPFHLSIVGSVHSHPDMPAYASGTDHEDQADFDGIHITYGWQKSVNNGATQYHIEMQMAGTAYSLKPEDVFETQIVIKDPDPEVVKWTENVSKKVQPPYSATGVTSRTQYPQPALKTSTTTQPTTTGIKSYKSKLSDVLPDFTMEDNAILVIELQRTDTHCPLCDWQISNVDVHNHICGGCGIYLADESETAMEIVDFVCYNETYGYGFTDVLSNPKREPEFNQIYFWCRDVNGQHMFLKIYDNGVTISSKDKDNEDELYSLYGSDYTLCCNVHIDDIAEKCTCAVTVTIEDMQLFEDKYPNLKVYDDNGGCFDCQNYLQPSCPSYRQLVVDWAANDTKPKDQSFDICDSFFKFHNMNWDDYVYDDDVRSLYY